MGILPIVAIAAFAVSKLKKSPEVSYDETSEISSNAIAKANAVARAQALKAKMEEAKAKAGKTRY